MSADDFRYSLADFSHSDAEDPLRAPAEYSAWMERCAGPRSLMEPRRHGAAGPRGLIDRAGSRREAIDLSSYNYLGLNEHPEVVEAAREALRRYGSGACGSPLLSGMTDLHRRLESAMASFLGREDAMLFNSGFAGGLGCLSSLLRRGDVAILDEKAHLCLIDGVRLAGARAEFFAHNDAAALDRALARHPGRRRVVVLEGVYSMDGDTADLAALVPVAESHGVGVFLDEAHSILVYGRQGGGLVEHCGMQGRIALQFGTFSKAFAGAGGYVAGDRELLQYMRYYARPYGFSCALPPSVVAGVLRALEVSREEPRRRERLWTNVASFREQARARGLDLGNSTSQVVPIMLGSDRRRLYAVCAEMNRRGLFLAPVDYPSVPEDGLRYRVALTAAHTPADLARALEILEDCVLRDRRGARSVHPVERGEGR